MKLHCFVVEVNQVIVMATSRALATTLIWSLTGNISAKGTLQRSLLTAGELRSLIKVTVLKVGNASISAYHDQASTFKLHTT